MRCIRQGIVCLGLLWSVSGAAQTVCNPANAIPEPQDPVSLLLTPGGVGQNWTLTFNKLSTDQYAEASNAPLRLVDPLLFRGTHPFNIPVTDTGEIDTFVVSVQGHNMLRTGTYVATDDASGTLKVGGSTYNNVERVHIREEYFYHIPPSLLFASGEEEDERFVFIADCYYWYQTGATVPLVTYQVLTIQYGAVLYRYKYLQTPFSEEGSSNQGKPSSSNQISIQELSSPAFNCVPNPAGNSVTITYMIPAAADVTIQAQDIVGRRYTLLPGTFHNAGSHVFDADLSNLPGGHYIVTMQTGHQIHSQKLVIKK